MEKDDLPTPSDFWLQGEEAIDLLIQGREEWNLWVKMNPDANVSFQDVDFTKIRKNFYEGVLSFKNFNFPSGEVNFNGARFGDGDVTFDGAHFGKGAVSFMNAVFMVGSKSFKRTIFEGNTTFFETNFGDGDINFTNAKFNGARTHFNRVICGEGHVVFNRTKFNCKIINFIRFLIKKGDLKFLRCKFNCKNAYFQGINLREGDVSFNSAAFRYIDITFERSYFNGFAIFTNFSGSEKIMSFDLRHCTFEKTLDLSGNNFKIIPDLTSIKVSHHVSLEDFTTKVQTRATKHILRHWLATLLVIIWGTRNLRTKYHKFYNLLPKNSWLSRHIAKDKQDIARVRRLKEIAESNKDHHKAIEFHVQEFKANRWIGNKKKSALITECLFDILSDYGRSEKRPLISLVVLWLIYSPIYACSSALTQTGERFSEAFSLALSDSLVYSFSQMLPLIPSSRSARLESATALFKGETPSWIYALTGTQSIMAFVLVFLLGLALRNRFRI